MDRYLTAVLEYFWPTPPPPLPPPPPAPAPPPPPPPPTLTENPWREPSNWSKELNKTLLDEINQLQPKTKQNLLILGPVGAGKSSFINSVVSIDKGHKYGMAMAGDFASRSWTLNLAAYSWGRILKGYRLFDCKGIEPSDGFLIADLLALINGHVIKGYKFNAVQSINKSDQFYRAKPNFQDKMHCVIFVVNATNVDDGIQNEYIDKIRTLQFELRNENIPRVMILTKVDLLCEEVRTDETKMFKSIKVQDTVNHASELFGIERASIHPVINYERDFNIRPEINIPILLGLRQAMHYSAHRVEYENETSDDGGENN